MNTKSPLMRPIQGYGRQGIRDERSREAIARGFVVQGSLSRGPLYSQPVYTPQPQGNARDPLTGAPRPQGSTVSAHQMQEQARQVHKSDLMMNVVSGLLGKAPPAPAPVSGAPAGPATPGAAPGKPPERAPGHPGPPATTQATGAPKAPSVPSAPPPHTQAPPAGQPAGFRQPTAQGHAQPPTPPGPATHQPPSTPGRPPHVPPPMPHPQAPPQAPVVKQMSPPPTFAPVNAGVGKSRTYIHSAAEAPPGAAIKTGEHGGMYYESGGAAPAQPQQEPQGKMVPFGSGPSPAGKTTVEVGATPEAQQTIFTQPAEPLGEEDIVATGGDIKDPGVSFEPVAPPPATYAGVPRPPPSEAEAPQPSEPEGVAPTDFIGSYELPEGFDPDDYPEVQNRFDRMEKQFKAMTDPDEIANYKESLMNLAARVHPGGELEREPRDPGQKELWAMGHIISEQYRYHGTPEQKAELNARIAKQSQPKEPVKPQEMDPSKYQTSVGEAARGAYQYGQQWGAAFADPGGGAYLKQIKQAPEQAAAAVAAHRARSQAREQAEQAHSKEMEQYEQAMATTRASQLGKGRFLTRVMQ